MKKIVSLILAGLMSVSLFAIGASAETVAKKTTTTPVNGALEGEWTGTKENGSDIKVKVESIVHKYAVDLTFDFADLTVGDITWDVNNLKYTSTKKFENLTQTVTISNRSDLSVWAKVTVDDTKDDFVTVEADSFADYTEVVKAKAANGTEVGKAESKAVKISLTSTEWNKFVEYYGAKFAAVPATTEYKLATITVFLKKTNA